MAIKCQSFRVFEANLNRSRAFLRLFDGNGRGPGKPSNDEKELPRGAVVFAIGALDAFLHDLVLEIVPKHGPSSDTLKDALKAIAREDPSLPLRVALAGDEVAAKAEFRSALDKWLSEKAFHGPQAVANALGYVGTPIAWQDFDAATHTDSAAAELERFTQDRHEIVHRGRKPYIKRSIAGSCVELVAALASRINEEVVAVHGA